MKRIWAPWRMKYIKTRNSKDECPFCAVLESPLPEDQLLIQKGTRVFVILNRYPYTSGHLLILPREHKERMEDLDPETRAEMMELINHALKVLEQVYHPEGFNVGMNMGKAAGAGIPKHLHWHVIPRWSGDTNFMTAAGEVRVLPELLEDTHAKILSAW